MKRIFSSNPILQIHFVFTCPNHLVIYNQKSVYDCLTTWLGLPLFLYPQKKKIRLAEEFFIFLRIFNKTHQII